MHFVVNSDMLSNSNGAWLYYITDQDHILWVAFTSLTEKTAFTILDP